MCCWVVAVRYRTVLHSRFSLHNMYENVRISASSNTLIYWGLASTYLQYCLATRISVGATHLKHLIPADLATADLVFQIPTISHLCFSNIQLGCLCKPTSWCVFSIFPTFAISLSWQEASGITLFKSSSEIIPSPSMSNNLPMAFSSWLPSGNDWRSYWKWIIYRWFTCYKWWFSIVFCMFTRE